MNPLQNQQEVSMNKNQEEQCCVSASNLKVGYISRSAPASTWYAGSGSASKWAAGAGSASASICRWQSIMYWKWPYLSTFSRFWAFIWKLGSGSASKGKGRIRIWIRIKVINRIRIRIRICNTDLQETIKTGARPNGPLFKLQSADIVLTELQDDNLSKLSPLSICKEFLNRTICKEAVKDDNTTEG